jgi:hypothetical protein
MRPVSTKTFYFQSDAHSLGGFVKHPSQKMISSQAHSSLPAVGGHVTTSTGAFNHDSIVSCRAAYSRVSGREQQMDGPWSIVATSVVEGLNILEVVTAERIVAQTSIEYSKDGKFPRISFAGSRFDQLRIAGHDVAPAMNAKYMGLRGEGEEPLSKKYFHEASREQGRKLIKSTGGDRAKTSGWIRDRFSWMDSDPKPGEDRCVLCSLVDGVDQTVPGRSFGHVLEIPEFGRIFLGEFFVSHGTVSLSMIRAELGCNVEGNLNISMLTTGGHTVPP